MRKTIINSEDYNFYYINFSIGKMKLFFSHNRIEHYVLAELEKIHPFFGSHCTVDIHLALNKLKLSLMAIVMDREILALYTKNQRLYIQKSNTKHNTFIKVFGLKNTNTQKHIALFVSLFIALAFTLLSIQNNKTAQNIIESIEPANEGDILGSSLEAFYHQMNKWLKNGVLCFSFSYTESNIVLQSNERQVIISTSISGLTPEEVYSFHGGEQGIFDISEYESELKISPVTFEKNIPQLNLTLSHVLHTESIESQISSTTKSAFMREAILMYGGVIQEENWDTQSINFVIPLSEWSSFFMVLQKKLQEENKTLKTISLVCENNASYVNAHIEIKNGSFPSNLLLLEAIFDNQLRADTHVIEAEKRKYQDSKIGSVKRIDGSEVLFYVTEDGRITSNIIW